MRSTKLKRIGKLDQGMHPVDSTGPVNAPGLYKPLVDPAKVFLPALHLKLAWLKTLLKAWIIHYNTATQRWTLQRDESQQNRRKSKIHKCFWYSSDLRTPD